MAGQASHEAKPGVSAIGHVILLQWDPMGLQLRLERQSKMASKCAQVSERCSSTRPGVLG